MKKVVKPLNPVLPKHIVMFEGFIKKWAPKFGLGGWRILRSSKKASRNNAAEIARCSPKDRLATWQLGADFGAEEVTPLSLERHAVHELRHVMLWEYKELIRDGAHEDHIMAAEHQIIITDVFLLVPGP